jgi:hypothetical protein
MGSSEIIPTSQNVTRILPAFSIRPLTAEALVLSRISPCAICGGQSRTGSHFSQSSPLSISVHLPTPYNGAINKTHLSLSQSSPLSISVHLPTPYNGAINKTHPSLSHSTPKSWCPSSQRRALDRTIKINCHLIMLNVHICKHVWIQEERKINLRTAECDRHLQDL